MVAAATVLMFLFLPTFTFHEEGLNVEYHFILNVPADHQINGPLLLVEWLGIILVAAIIWSLISSRSNTLQKDRESPQNNSSTAPGSSGNTAQSPTSKLPESDT